MADWHMARRPRRWPFACSRRSAVTRRSPWPGESGALPGNRSPVPEEAAGRSAVRKLDRPHHARRALAHRTAPAATHVGGRPARADRVDADAVAPELRREGARQGVERRLARVVAGRASAHAGERAALARYVHDPAV